ncbi:hypothetical protein [Sandaracinus amylolyticus]|uniref:hypothetical protein n=1 Tax=Sandaracinus amylolyticus TaxID=927083 RepID=UPI001F455861|nr:hypothetical protein [Sandaracinus amylolyticus]
MARSVAKLTVALVTPSTRVRARSTRRTHAAQVIPRIGRSAVCDLALSMWGRGFAVPVLEVLVSMSSSGGCSASPRRTPATSMHYAV